MEMSGKKPVKSEAIEFSERQERVHANLHILGIFFGAIGVPLLIYTGLNKDTYSLLGITVYGICYLMVFVFSSLYHSSRHTKIKRLYKKLDRISIYFLIAGTYTPIVKFYIFNEAGLELLKIAWGLVVLGIFFELWYPDKFRLISILFYLFMGLLFMFLPINFFGSMPDHIARLVMAGVVLYTVGVIFYVWHKWQYHHAAWHLFVLSASICHYLAVLYTIESLK